MTAPSTRNRRPGLSGRRDAQRGRLIATRGIQQVQELTDEARRVMAVIAHAPGCNLSEARVRSGLGRHVFANALDALKEAGLAHRMTTGRGVRLLPDRPGLRDCLDQVKALWDPRVRSLHGFLDHRDLRPHREILDHAARSWGWDAEATRWRLRLLEQADLAQAVLDFHDHRCINYRGLPAHPTVREVLGAAGMDA